MSSTGFPSSDDSDTIMSYEEATTLPPPGPLGKESAQHTKATPQSGKSNRVFHKTRGAKREREDVSTTPQTPTTAASKNRTILQVKRSLPPGAVKKGSKSSTTSQPMDTSELTQSSPYDLDDRSSKRQKTFDANIHKKTFDEDIYRMIYDVKTVSVDKKGHLEQAKAFKDQRNFAKCFEELRAAYADKLETIPALIKEKITATAKENNPEKALMLFERAIVIAAKGEMQQKFEETGIQLVEKMLHTTAGGKKSRQQTEELTDHEKNQLEEFLLYAAGNKDLNKRMRDLRSPNEAQQFIAAFSFKMPYKGAFEAALQKIKGLLSSPDINTIYKKSKAVRKLYSSMVPDLKSISIDAKAMHTHLSAHIERLKSTNVDSSTIVAIGKMRNEIGQFIKTLDAFSHINPHSEMFDIWAKKFHAQYVTLPNTLSNFIKASNQAADSIKLLAAKFEELVNNMGKLSDSLSTRINKIVQTRTEMRNTTVTTRSEDQLIRRR